MLLYVTYQWLLKTKAPMEFNLFWREEVNSFQFGAERPHAQVWLSKEEVMADEPVIFLGNTQMKRGTWNNNFGTILWHLSSPSQPSDKSPLYTKSEGIIVAQICFEWETGQISSHVCGNKIPKSKKSIK